jgi:5-methylcytosine-specific restriction endonuclease McrA
MPTRPPIHKPYPSRERGRGMPIHRVAQREGANVRGYTYRWQQARLAFLAQHPLCACDECTRTGRILVATVVDHRIPHRGDTTLFWDRSNWVPMAKPCHDAKTAREDGGLGNRSRHGTSVDGSTRGRVGQKSKVNNF